jgi:hypothetical protein
VLSRESSKFLLHLRTAISINVAFYVDLERKTRHVSSSCRYDKLAADDKCCRSTNVDNRCESTRSDAPVNFFSRFSHERKNTRSVLSSSDRRRRLFPILDSSNRASRRKAIYKSIICHAVADNREGPSPIYMRRASWISRFDLFRGRLRYAIKLSRPIWIWPRRF